MALRRAARNTSRTKLKSGISRSKKRKTPQFERVYVGRQQRAQCTVHRPRTGLIVPRNGRACSFRPGEGEDLLKDAHVRRAYYRREPNDRATKSPRATSRHWIFPPFSSISARPGSRVIVVIVVVVGAGLLHTVKHNNCPLNYFNGVRFPRRDAPANKGGSFQSQLSKTRRARLKGKKKKRRRRGAKRRTKRIAHSDITAAIVIRSGMTPAGAFEHIAVASRLIPKHVVSEERRRSFLSRGG